MLRQRLADSGQPSRTTPRLGAQTAALAAATAPKPSQLARPPRRIYADQVALEVGLQAALVHEVAEADTSIALGSGDVAVLATPRLVALAEASCVAALSEAVLAASSTSVGTRIELEHLRGLPVGEMVRVAARLEHVDGRLLRFAVVATDDGDRLVATATLTRVIVDRERFLERSRR